MIEDIELSLILRSSRQIKLFQSVYKAIVFGSNKHKKRTAVFVWFASTHRNVNSHIFGQILNVNMHVYSQCSTVVACQTSRDEFVCSFCYKTILFVEPFYIFSPKTNLIFAVIVCLKFRVPCRVTSYGHGAVRGHYSCYITAPVGMTCPTKYANCLAEILKANSFICLIVPVIF